MKRDAASKITKTRANLIMKHPFIGVLALRIKMKEDPTCPTAWVDGVTMGYNPEWIKKLSDAECIGVVAHEIFHCIFQHMTRRQGRDPQKWNIAGDYVINANLKAAGFILPEGGLVDIQYQNQTTDHVYSILPDPPKQEGGTIVILPPGMGDDGDGSGQSAPDGADPGQCGGVRDAPGGSNDATVQEIEGEWKVAVAQAARAAKTCGKMPGAWENLIEEILRSKVDWKDILREFVVTRAKNDYSWMRPNRRFIGQGLILPALYSEQMGEIVVAVDTSGSVSDGEMAQFFSEMSAITEECNPEKLHVVQCDTVISHTTEYTKDDMPIPIAERKRHGYGGTDFRPPFKWVTDQNIQPTCLVYLTDMEAYDFPEEPDYPVLWVSTTDKGDHAPFGEVICIK